MWVKICGIRDLETAERVAKWKPDAIGLNFYAETLRAVTVETAAGIVDRLPESIEPVGVFVNHTVEEIIRTCERCNIQTVQLHGDEPPQLLSELLLSESRLNIIRAFRMGPDGLEPLARYLQECEQLNLKLWACLIDARVEGLYGGSGRTVPWKQVAAEYQQQNWPKMILAGGLTRENVAEAIRVARPWGVDVAGGVESSPGEKDFKLVENFITTARRAFSEFDK